MSGNSPPYGATDQRSDFGEPEPVIAALDVLLSGVGGITWELDLGTGLLTHVSDTATLLLGYPRERWLGEPDFLKRLMVRPEDREEFIEAARGEGGQARMEWQLKDEKGSLKWVRVQTQYLPPITEGAPPLLRGLMVDVSEERAYAEKLSFEAGRAALAASVGATLGEGGTLDEMLQRSVEAIVKHLGAAFARIWTVDHGGTVLTLRASAGLYTHLDGDHSRIPIGMYKIGKIAEERRPHLTNDVANDPRVGDQAWAAREGMVAFAGYPLLIGKRLLGVLAMFSRNALPEESLDALHLVADRVGMVIEQKRAQERLQEREAQLAEAQRIAGVGSWEWETGLARVTWSDELYRIYGMEPQSEPLTFDSYLSRVVPEDRERVRDVIFHAVRDGGAFDFLERIIRPDGEVRLLHSRGQAVQGRSGETARLVGTCQDVTEQQVIADREMELAREQALRMHAEHEERRSALLAEVSRTLSSTLDYEATLRNVAHVLVPEVADWCTIDLLGEDGRPYRVVTAHPDPAKEKMAEELERRFPSSENADFGVPKVLSTGEAELAASIPRELLEQLATSDEHLRLLLALELRSYIIVPLRAGDRTLGAITLVREEASGSYGHNDLDFARELARRAALALDNARLYREARRAREQTGRILESITDAFFSLDRQWRFAFVNDQAERVLQRKRDELLGRSIWDELPGSLGVSLRERYQQAIDSNRTVQIEEYHPPLGAWLEIRMYPSSDGLSVYLHDVTDKRNAEAATREREEQFRFLADSIPQQVWVTRPDGYHEYYNHRWYEYTGTTDEKAMGTGWAALVHPDDLEETKRRWAHSLQTGEPYSAEYRLRRADGVFRWFLGQAMPQRGPDGTIVRWFGTLTDIQDQKEGEEERDRLISELDLERRRLRHIFQEAPAFIATLRGPDHVFETANPRYLQLVGHRDVLGKPVAKALPEVVGQGFTELLDGVIESGEPFLGREMEILLQREPGGDSELRILDFVFQPMLDISGTPVGIFVHGIDVTDQVIARQTVEEKAEELLRLTRALEISNRELDQFAYVASHDLKAPLRGIANLSQWIEEDFGVEVPQEAREHLELLRGRVHRMEGLIDGILRYSRAGRTEDAPEVVDVGELIREVTDLLSPAEGTDIRVEGAMPVFVTERLPLQQVFLNLVGNALKYGGSATRVEISVREAGSFFEFVVRDDGPGIAPEFHDRIFGIFQRLEARDKVEGTGIGLSLVRKMVDTRHGRVWVESQEGSGAAFHFQWPRHHNEEI
jgi:PAS domain S-box-containing protein